MPANEFVIWRIKVDLQFPFFFCCFPLSFSQKRESDSARDTKKSPMSKKAISASIRLLIGAGQAKPAPPVGPALGQAGLNIMAFCKDFNAATSGIKVSCLFVGFVCR